MEESATIDDVMTVLNSLNEFDLEIIASMVAGYLLFFSLGYITGTIAKILKRA